MNHEKQVLCWRTRSGPQKRHGNERERGEREERERESTDVHPPFASFKWGFPSWGGWPYYIHPMFWPCASAPRLGWSDPFEVHSAFPDLTPMEPRVTLVAWLIDHSVISPGTPQANLYRSVCFLFFCKERLNDLNATSFGCWSFWHSSTLALGFSSSQIGEVLTNQSYLQSSYPTPPKQNTPTLRLAFLGISSLRIDKSSDVRVISWKKWGFWWDSRAWSDDAASGFFSLAAQWAGKSHGKWQTGQ